MWLVLVLDHHHHLPCHEECTVSYRVTSYDGSTVALHFDDLDRAVRSASELLVERHLQVLRGEEPLKVSQLGFTLLSN